MTENPSILSHVSIGTNNFEAALSFYDSVMEPLGCTRVLEHLELGAVAYGKMFPEFWVQKPIDENVASVGNGTHFGFVAASIAMVDEFYKRAMAGGAECDGPPGPRPQYSDAYYGCFVRDLDGHKIEATFWDASKM